MIGFSPENAFSDHTWTLLKFSGQTNKFRLTKFLGQYFFSRRRRTYEGTRNTYYCKMWCNNNIYIYISDRGSLLADTREPYDLILKKIGGLLKEMLKSKNLDWHDRPIMGSASSRPCPDVTHILFGSRISFQEISRNLVSASLRAFLSVLWCS